MQTIHNKKGYTLKIEGKPAATLAHLPKPGQVAVLPEQLAFVRPRLRVKVGDAVRAGSVLFEDKRNPEVVFLSPGGGRVAEINFGPRRIIREIVIKLAETEAYEELQIPRESDLEGIPRRELVQALMRGGLWPLLRELPFRDIARPDRQPPAIFVSVGNTEPFHPRPEVYLQGKEQLFEFGLGILRRLADGNLFLTAHGNDAFIFMAFESLVTHVYDGCYPAHDPGVLLYRTKKSAAENRAWYVEAQDVLLLAQLFKTGRYPLERTVVLAGSLAPTRQHYQTRLGVGLDHIAGARTARDRSLPDGTRWVVGGLFTGYRGARQSYLGFYETSLLLIPDGNEREFLALFKPGYIKPSFHRTFLSAFNPGPFEVNCNRHGEERACVACGACNNVCPVDILVQLCYKAILAGEVEESLAHGLLDCVECGLCTFVCPSKIELFQTLKQAKFAYAKEMAG